MNKRIYNLDGLRFIAAMLIVARHFHSLCRHYNIPAFAKEEFLYIAQPAVTLFFVISGYLITLVLSKKEKIDLGKFYRNRTLRIWPLYYLVIVLSFAVTPYIPALNIINRPVNYFNIHQFLGYIFFLPNTTEFFYGATHFLGVTWSLGVEEFFYLFFPLLLFTIPKKWHLRSLIILTIIYSLITIGAALITVPDNAPYRYGLLLHKYIPRYRIYAFLLGGIVFLLPVSKFKYRSQQILGSKTAVYFIWILIPFLFAAGIHFGVFNELVMAFIFATGLYSMRLSNIRISLLDNQWMNYLGKISYGIYLLHSFAIIIVLNLISPYLNLNIGTSILLFLIVSGATILLAAMIYELYEKAFLRFKKS